MSCNDGSGFTCRHLPRDNYFNPESSLGNRTHLGRESVRLINVCHHPALQLRPILHVTQETQRLRYKAGLHFNIEPILQAAHEGGQVGGTDAYYLAVNLKFEARLCQPVS